MLWEQGVTGSNPVTPTTENQAFTKLWTLFLCLFLVDLQLFCIFVTAVRHG